MPEEERLGRTTAGDADTLLDSLFVMQTDFAVYAS